MSVTATVCAVNEAMGSTGLSNDPDAGCEASSLMDQNETEPSSAPAARMSQRGLILRTVIGRKNFSTIASR